MKLLQPSIKRPTDCCVFSTVSSLINALAAVTLEDLIKPYIRRSERHLLVISKALSECLSDKCCKTEGHRMESVSHHVPVQVSFMALSSSPWRDWRQFWEGCCR